MESLLVADANDADEEDMDLSSMTIPATKIRKRPSRKNCSSSSETACVARTTNNVVRCLFESYEAHDLMWCNY